MRFDELRSGDVKSRMSNLTDMSRAFSFQYFNNSTLFAHIIYTIQHDDEIAKDITTEKNAFCKKFLNLVEGSEEQSEFVEKIILYITKCTKSEAEVQNIKYLLWIFMYVHYIYCIAKCSQLQRKLRKLIKKEERDSRHYVYKPIYLSIYLSIYIYIYIYI